MARSYSQRPSLLFSYHWRRGWSGEHEILSSGVQCNGDYIGFLTGNSDLRWCWCPPSSLCLISISSQLEIHIDVHQAAKDVGAAQDALIDIFERIENFFKRLETYTEVPPTEAMTDIIVKIMVEVLNIFAIATKEIRQGRTSELPDDPICILLNRFH